MYKIGIYNKYEKLVAFLKNAEGKPFEFDNVDDAREVQRQNQDNFERRSLHLKVVE